MRAAHAPAQSHWFHAAPLFTRLLTSFEKRKLRVRDRAAALSSTQLSYLNSANFCSSSRVASGSTILRPVSSICRSS